MFNHKYIIPVSRAATLSVAAMTGFLFYSILGL